ncbi:hypothetical protein LTR94_014317 [Friedmanniomyces endolithicus]|nr:hypothetical protein LTR94_014317 [Friedmanniomyces endolithicus]
MSSIAVFFNSSKTFRTHLRANHFVHEQFMQFSEVGIVMLSQKFKHKFIIGNRVELPCFVVFIKFIVHGAMANWVDQAFIHQKLSPRMI